jgi:hypothetical protein
VLSSISFTVELRCSTNGVIELALCWILQERYIFVCRIIPNVGDSLKTLVSATEEIASNQLALLKGMARVI